MTAQATDTLYFDGKRYNLHSEPLEEYFKQNPEKLPVGYDLTISSFDRQYWEEGGRGWDGVSNGNHYKQQGKQKQSNEPDFMDNVPL